MIHQSWWWTVLSPSSAKQFLNRSGFVKSSQTIHFAAISLGLAVLYYRKVKLRYLNGDPVPWWGALPVEALPIGQHSGGSIKGHNFWKEYILRFLKTPPFKNLKATTEVRKDHLQWWRDLFRCQIDLLNLSMGFNIIAPYMEFLHLNWYIAEWTP